MKVIVAGMPKTGTKTMKAALEELGYSVYDLLENFQYLNKDWQKIFNEEGTTEDFRRMFENVDAVTDVPGCYFWDEIHKAFPEAKIILTMRENEEAWCRSFQNQMRTNDSNKAVIALSYLSPTMRKLLNYVYSLARVVFGEKAHFSLFRSYKPNMMLSLMTYRRHNSHVLQTAPKDRLLIFRVQDGWKPLCEFLGVEIPERPFPHENKKGEITEKVLQIHPVLLRAKKEMLITTGCLSLVLLFGAYKVARSPSCAKNLSNSVLQLVSPLKFW